MNPRLPQRARVSLVAAFGVSVGLKYIGTPVTMLALHRRPRVEEISARPKFAAPLNQLWRS